MSILIFIVSNYWKCYFTLPDQPTSEIWVGCMNPMPYNHLTHLNAHIPRQLDFRPFYILFEQNHVFMPNEELIDSLAKTMPLRNHVQFTNKLFYIGYWIFPRKFRLVYVRLHVKKDLFTQDIGSICNKISYTGSRLMRKLYLAKAWTV